MRFLILCLILVTGCTCTARADDTAKAVPAYRIAAQDVLDITIQDHADLSRTVSVLPDGAISFPYMGEFVVTGLTLPQLTERIGAGLRKQIADPVVTITMRTIHEAPAHQVSILGAVKSPGKRVLKDGWRVFDLLIDAGGLTSDRPELFSATLIRNGSIILPIDVARVLAARDQNANATLMPDDVVLVHELEPAHVQAQILGEVARPGAYAVDREGSLTSFIGAAGGVSPRAALSKATITHDGKTSIVDLRGLASDGKTPDGVKIAPGDTLFIPVNRLYYSLFGAVGRQGMQEFPDGGSITVLTALSQAGGQVVGANLKSVSIIHPMKDGKPSVVTVNVEVMMKKGDLTHDVALHPGDIVYIPLRSGRHGLGLTDVLPYLSMIGWLSAL